MKIYRNPEAMWREEDLQKARAAEGLEKGEDVGDIGTSIVLMNGTIHSLNILGTEIWKLCEGKTRAEIVAALQEVFDVGPDTLEADVSAFITNLIKLGLVDEK